MITNEVPVTILQAYFSLPRHACKGMDYCVRFIYSSWLPAISQRNKKTSKIIMFEHNYSFYHHCYSLAVRWYSKNSNLSIPKWGHKQSLGGARSPCPSPHRSDGTVYHQYCHGIRVQGFTVASSGHDVVIVG